MIDLESIAEARAKTLNQSEKDWAAALIQPVFNELTTYLTDGEVEDLVSHFTSPTDLILVSGSFLKEFRSGKDSSFFDFVAEVREKGFYLKDAFHFLAAVIEAERRLQKNWTFEQKLSSLRAYWSDHSSFDGGDISRWLPA